MSIKQEVLDEIAQKYFKNCSTWEQLIRYFGKDKSKQMIEFAIDLTMKKCKKATK
jgi:hypothetical protein